MLYFCFGIVIISVLLIAFDRKITSDLSASKKNLERMRKICDRNGERNEQISNLSSTFDLFRKRGQTVDARRCLDRMIEIQGEWEELK